MGAKANPPKNPKSPLKNGKVIAMNMVKAAMKKEASIYSYKYQRPSKIEAFVWFGMRLLTDVYISHSETKNPARLKIQFLHKHGFNHVKHWHGVNLDQETHKNQFGLV